ncbi:MAG: adenosylcobalamin-dependent ribonucleoside-diphosphate reductase [Candidatus Lokiarchaeota archaeon]|nr:adenosylcobalamin-dependent ribonucleoside-diphosphate reductase [Candidatus Lokiarchaeota archaeon]
MVEFTDIAIKILNNRYLIKDEAGNVVEKPEEMLHRVAKNIAKADLKFDYSEREIKKQEKEFFKMMDNLEFLPNSPTLMNAGTTFQQLSACFVLPINDNLDSIFNTIKNTALIHQTGGGTGFNFSKLRPKNDIVRGIPSAAGPVNFMKIYDATTDIIKQGGRRRGANMGILNCNHPDIIDFITAKMDTELLKNFNISVGIKDDFINAAINDNSYDLINPRTNEKVKSVDAKKILELISMVAWRTGDPGMIFLDTINKENPLKEIGLIQSTNPCGEVPLFPYESCNLGSINLSKLVKNGSFDYDRLKTLIHTAVHFLDNVIDMCKFPIEKITEMVHKTRKIGLGIMGYADLLFQLKIPYDSERALDFIEEMMQVFKKEAFSASEKLAEIKGPFPYIDKSIYKEKRKIRNSTIISIAPTGTISMLADCTSGIEPVYGLIFTRKILEDEQITILNKYLKKELQKLGNLNNVINTLKKTGSIQDTNLPKETKEIFKTTLEIDPMYHLKTQATFQKYVDNSISKTINLPTHTPPEKIKEIFIRAWKLGCKGITIYRNQSRSEQVLHYSEKNIRRKEKIERLEDNCPECKSKNVLRQGKCFLCKECGFSHCNI